MIEVAKFENSPIDSISYILSNPDNRRSVIIDPGTENDIRITDYLDKENRISDFVFLTHEHFDHIAGVNFLRRQYSNVQVISSSKTSERLPNPKKNLAIFHDQNNLIVNEADIIIEEGIIELIGLKFEVLFTPGHTDSSICLKYENLLFSGDFLLQGSRIVTNLPTGSKKQYQESLEKYNDLLKGMTIYPGHGVPFVYLP